MLLCSILLRRKFSPNNGPARNSILCYPCPASPLSLLFTLCGQQSALLYQSLCTCFPFSRCCMTKSLTHLLLQGCLPRGAFPKHPACYTQIKFMLSMLQRDYSFKCKLKMGEKVQSIRTCLPGTLTFIHRQLLFIYGVQGMGHNVSRGQPCFQSMLTEQALLWT